ncbi:transcription termination/antitermination factor NusG [Candidatus Dojkabacteria bacterium]|uniref:Transcription termination/antitermination protein NusG n=1 Tax=Candidatus Dojkabacteria bacterium TaxID=2099670 RepID=A0A955LBZ1_9BACT|nr:transcription termination/antitermination factor NusG [Candidatus Dojkabacteria bacterium]
MAEDKENTKKMEPEKAKKENKDAKWYIVKAISGKENSTALLLKQRISATGLDDIISEVVVPTQDKIVIKKGKKETKNERIFPGYILVHMNPTEEALHLVRNTDGVQGFIGYNQRTRKPTPLKEHEVKGILEFTKVKQAPTYQSKFNINDTVKVNDGPFKEFIGTVQEVNEAKGQVTVLLSIFGRETPVQLDFLKVTHI